MSITASAFAKKKIDISAFVDHIREVNKEAVRIVNAPLGSDKVAKLFFRQELANVLGELEQTVKVLRVATDRDLSASGRPQASSAGKPDAKRDEDSAQAALVLDTT